MITATRSGNLAAIAAHLGAIFVAAKDNPSQKMCVSELSGTELVQVHAFDCGPDGSGNPDLWSTGAELWLGFIPAAGDRAIVINLTTGERREHQGLCGIWAVVFGANGYAICFNRQGYYETLTFRYDGYTGPDAPVATLTNRGSGQGLARVADDLLSVITTDENASEELAQWGVLNPDYAGAAFTGEGHSSGGVPVVYGGVTKKIWFDGNPNCVRPKIAQLGATWSIVTSDYQTLTLLSGIAASDFGDVTVPPIDPPVGPPVDPPATSPTVIVLRAGQSLVVRTVA